MGCISFAAAVGCAAVLCVARALALVWQRNKNPRKKRKRRLDGGAIAGRFVYGCEAEEWGGLQQVGIRKAVSVAGRCLA